jgi:hypothetical protein
VLCSEDSASLLIALTNGSFFCSRLCEAGAGPL